MGTESVAKTPHAFVNCCAVGESAEGHVASRAPAMFSPGAAHAALAGIDKALTP